MKILRLLLTISVCLMAVRANVSNPLEWTDPASGTKYDFSALKKSPDDPWKVKDGADNGLFSMIYYFNFGISHNKKCKGQSVAVSEVLEVLKQPTDTCEILGKSEARTVGLLDPTDPKKGIYVSYGNGDKCTNGDNPMQNGKPRQGKFNIHCADRQDDNFVVDLPGGTQGTTKCVLEFKINSPAGCPGGSGATKSSVILFWVVIAFLLYFGFGTVYNMKQNNLSGKEAVPNIEFWRTFPVFVQDGMAAAVAGTSKFVGFVKGKVSGNNSAYNDL